MRRLIARYAKECSTHLEVITVWDDEMEKEELPHDKPHIKTISHSHPAAIWFERKMHDDFGIVVEGAFDNRPLVAHERFLAKLHPMRKSFTKTSVEYADYRPYKYETVRGDGVFEVAVGPIHAGIIEPGHFHFSQAGEDILHQEVRHFYKYRAIEKMVEGKTLAQAKPIIERISGNETIAYQIALRDIMLQAANTELPESNRKYHAMLLELERTIHHLTDLGFIPNDAGFGAALSVASRFSEDARRQMHSLTGHRFGFGAIDFSSHQIDPGAMNGYIDTLEESLDFFEKWIVDIPSLWDRFDTTGILDSKKAIQYDTVGVVARASGVEIDRREERFYKEHGFEMAIQHGCDVAARFKIRLKEAKNSAKMMRNFLTKECETVKIEEIEDGEYFAYSESSIGELFMNIEIRDGVIERFFARDPSFINWQALHLMMPDNIIADFPLINKSCDLSYAGNDL